MCTSDLNDENKKKTFIFFLIECHNIRIVYVSLHIYRKKETMMTICYFVTNMFVIVAKFMQPKDFEYFLVYFPHLNVWSCIVMH